MTFVACLFIKFIFIHLLCKILTMPCDVQVWDQISPNGISKLSFLVVVHNQYIYEATLDCHVLKVFRLRFGPQMLGKGVGTLGIKSLRREM